MPGMRSKHVDLLPTNCFAMFAFAALKKCGSVVTWGSAYFGGDSRSVAEELSSGVVSLCCNGSAFAALKEGGKVVTWGDRYNGGDAAEAATRLKNCIRSVCPGRLGFAAVSTAGSVVCWGAPSILSHYSVAESQLQEGVRAVTSVGYGFCAEKTNGKFVLWGAGLQENSALLVAQDALDVDQLEDDEKESAESLQKEAVQVCRNGFAAAVLLRDGSVRTFGRSNRGGDAGAVADKLQHGVRHLFSNNWAFAALRELD
eukprot:TRINITY_DN23333_c0_g1_i4.p1 TRINITY_DN23333_c0_g1~~TRINITY_DN23333_c0_g1_i4.p1  ORF type:complete len:257 (+),score=34.60 TRINITY_DN23333_c0_g1_i4:205-975(+)